MNNNNNTTTTVKAINFMPIKYNKDKHIEIDNINVFDLST